jgi:hypothetical protein
MKDEQMRRQEKHAQILRDADKKLKGIDPKGTPPKGPK